MILFQMDRHVMERVWVDRGELETDSGELVHRHHSIFHDTDWSASIRGARRRIPE